MGIFLYNKARLFISIKCSCYFGLLFNVNPLKSCNVFGAVPGITDYQLPPQILHQMEVQTKMLYLDTRKFFTKVSTYGLIHPFLSTESVPFAENQSMMFTKGIMFFGSNSPPNKAGGFFTKQFHFGPNPPLNYPNGLQQTMMPISVEMLFLASGYVEIMLIASTVNLLQ